MASSGVFGKLQLKDQAEIVVLDAPASFEKAFKALKGVLPPNLGRFTWQES